MNRAAVLAPAWRPEVAEAGAELAAALGEAPADGSTGVQRRTVLYDISISNLWSAQIEEYDFGGPVLGWIEADFARK